MMQTSRTHTTRHHSTRHTFPCPTCKRIYQQGDRFCGFCYKPLQLQCASCGRWTKADHACCPSCGASLHGVGLSFEEKRHLQRLEQNHQEIDAALAACTRDLKAAFAGRRRTIRRLIVAGALSVGTIITLVHLLATLVSSLAGLLLLFVFLFVFHRLFLWGLPRLLGHFWRWVAPGDLAAWQREIEALEEEQVQRTVELSHTEREIAALEDSEDLEEDEWGDWEEEEDLEDAFALGEGEEKENDLEDAGSPGGKDSTGKKLLTQFKAVLAKGKRARIAPRFGKKANNIHPGKEDHTQELDEPPAQPGEEEGEDLLEFDWD